MPLDEADLSFFAERIGKTRDRAWLSTLLLLARHRSPLVREGAVLGLDHFWDDPLFARFVDVVAIVDPSPGVRAAARDCRELREMSTVEAPA